MGFHRQPRVAVMSDAQCIFLPLVIILKKNFHEIIDKRVVAIGE
jgi:hypothetical protein